MCRAYVTAPVPSMILWCARSATIWSNSGATALRPRSIMLWPLILTTFTQGSIVTSGVASVARSSVESLSDPLTNLLLKLGKHGIITSACRLGCA